MILILRKDKYILRRIDLYFLVIWGEAKRFLAIWGARHYLQGDVAINALFSGIKGARTPLGASKVIRSMSG